MSRSKIAAFGLATVLALMIACARSSSPTSPSAQGGGGVAPAAADGSTLKATAPLPLSPVNDAALNSAPVLTAIASSMKYTDPAGLQYRFEVFNDTGAKVVDSGLVNSPSYTVGTVLVFQKRHTWRVRAERDGALGPWSSTASFISSAGGYIRGNEVFDPLFNGVTVGERIGPTVFVPDKGIQLQSITSYVRYVIPQTITSGEFSMEIEGLRANAPGDKTKVFGMSTNSDDFITDPFRVDIQYRGTVGFPPNAITFRALYGGPDVYEPDTAVRLASVFNLNPGTTYYWKATWGTEFRVTVREGGIDGRTLYNVGVPTPRGVYNPQPHYAYLGAPSGRSGAESASIPGAIYRNVWIGARPRP